MHSRRRSGRLAVAVVTSALMLGGLAGCGEDDPAPGDGSSSSPQSSDADPSSSGPSDGPSDGSSDTTTDTGDSGAEPAAGPVLDLPSYSVHAPEGFTTEDDGDPDALTARRAGEIGTEVRAEDVETVSGLTLDQSAEAFLKSTSISPRPKRLEDVEVDGVTMFHLSGPSSDFQYVDIYGATPEDRNLTIFVRTNSDLVSEAQRQQLAESVLASVDFK